VANNLARFWRWTKGVAGLVPRQKRMEITVETERVVVIRRREATRGWCPHCEHEVEIVTPEDAAAIAGANSRLLGDGETQNWHFADGVEKWVCLESLLRPESRGNETGSEPDR